MAATMYIHVFEGITEDDLAAFFGNTLGSKWFSPADSRTPEERSRAYEKIAETPDFRVGDVSWLKAALFDDGEEESAFIPGPIQAIHNLIGEDLPELDDKLIAGIMAALELENTTGYDVASPQEIKSFLENHRGKQVFTVSW